MRFRLGLLAAAALGAAVLAAPARVVYGSDGVRLLGDTDPHYHVLRAERILRGAPGAPWRDPALDWPDGGDILWPPAFDVVIAAAARIAGAETRDDVARVAAPLPLLIGLASIVLAGLAGRRLAGDGAGVLAAVIVALLPAHARVAAIGRVDQHVAEIALATLVAVSFARGLERGAERAAVLGVASGVVLAFWTWMGSTVSLVAPCATVAIARLVGLDDAAGRGARTLALGLGAGALALAASVGLVGRPGALAHPTVQGVGGLHVAILAGAAAFSALLAWRSRTPAPAWRRAVEVALALAIPAGLLLGLWPALRDGVGRGLEALAAANAWYADIREYSPLLFSGMRPISAELANVAAALGLLPLAAMLAIPAGVERWRTEPRARAGLLLLAVWTTAFAAVTVARNRFLPYAAVPLAIGSAAGALWAARRLAAAAARPRLAPALAGGLLAVALAPAVPALASVAAGEARVPEPWIEAARWFRDVPPGSAASAAIAGPWDLGHLVQYYGDRPVVSSPFGTDAGLRGLPDWAAVLFTTDPAAAERILRARAVSHVLLKNPSHELVGLRGFAAEAAQPLVVTRDPWKGETVSATPLLDRLVVSRLFFRYGEGSPSIDYLRLVFEGATTHPPHPLLEERLVAYERVAGADVRVTGAVPGALATATILVTTPAGVAFRWRSARIADARGDATFRIPYATGANGASRAGPCVLADARSVASIELPAGAVEHGDTVRVALAR